MGRYVSVTWEGDFNAEGGRRARQSRTITAYIPSTVFDLELTLPAGIQEEIAEAENFLRELQDKADPIGLESLSSQLLRSESVSSSHIEGLQISQRRLAEVLYNPKKADSKARSILGNISAMKYAIELGSGSDALSVEDIENMHRLLLEHTDEGAIAGQIREAQNWVGGGSSNPFDAKYIPPPYEEVMPLLEDLCAFIARGDIHPIAQAAITHAQFETIHPFADGNGRVGRALIHVVLRRRGLAPKLVPPISTILASNARRYIEELTKYRGEDIAIDSIGWIRFFTRTLLDACSLSFELARDLEAMIEGWKALLSHHRQDASVWKLIIKIPSCPILDTNMAAELAGVSYEAARNAVSNLESAGILRKVSVGRGKRAWLARDVIDLLHKFEWEAGTPTQSGEPRRATANPTATSEWERRSFTQ